MTNPEWQGAAQAGVQERAPRRGRRANRRSRRLGSAWSGVCARPMTPVRTGSHMYMSDASMIPADTTTTDRISSTQALGPARPGSCSGNTSSRKPGKRVPRSEGTPTAHPAPAVRASRDHGQERAHRLIAGAPAGQRHARIGWLASQRWPSLLTNTTRRVPLLGTRSGKRMSGLAVTAGLIWNSLIFSPSRKTSICLT